MALADKIRQLLAAKPEAGITEIAGYLGISVQEVEQVFRAAYREEAVRLEHAPSPQHLGTRPRALPHDVITAEPAYKIGANVKLRANSTQAQAGIVTEVRPWEGGYEYYVFFSQDHRAWYDEEQLLLVHEIERTLVGRDETIKNLALIKIRGRFSDVLYSYLASRTVVQPHQFRPAAKFLETTSSRLLIADEVGLGKTIEAGIIFLEMKARTNLERFLVVCPSRLRDKWVSEFRDRFGETLTNMDSQGFRGFLDKIESGERGPLSAVVAMESIRDELITGRIAELGIHFDLVVIDEAHHLRNPGTLTNKMGHTLADAADALLMLTATPVNLGDGDLFHLLNILSPGDFPDTVTFSQFRDPAEIVNHAMRLLGPTPDQQGACLEKIMELSKLPLGQDITRQPEYETIRAKLEKGNELPPSEIAVLTQALSSLNPLSRVVNRTRKRDVPDSGAIRDAYTHYVELTDVEHAFYEEYLNYARLEYMRQNQSMPIGFAMVMKERQAASCLAATRNALRLNQDDDGYEGLDSEIDFDTEEDVGIERIIDSEASVTESQLERDAKLSRQKLLELGKEMGAADSKFRSFISVLNTIHANEPKAKVIVFSSFKRTLRYVAQELYPWISSIAGGIRLLTGDVPVEERTALISQFENAERFSVLLMSEVGSEGLDFQFTDILINYDLPWNPMRVEQRIGRVDRFGQQSEKVRIYSLLLADTIETRILERLYERIGVFQRSIGELEPILGGLVRRLTRSIFSRDLSEQQKQEQAQREIDAIENEKIYREELNNLEDELMGQDILLSQEKDERIGQGKFLSDEELRTLLVTGLIQRYGSAYVNETSDGYFLLRPNPNLPQDLLTFCRRSRRPSRIETRTLMDLNNGEMLITFRGDLAHMHPSVHLLNSQHPLTEFAAASFLDIRSDSICVLHWDNPDWKGGAYPFFLYSVDIQAIDARLELAAVVMDQDCHTHNDLAEGLLGNITTMIDWTGPEPFDIVRNWNKYLEIADRHSADNRGRIRRDAQSRNDALLDIRRTAIVNTYNAKLNRIQEQLADASNPRIVRMREGELRNRTADRDHKLQELETRREVSVGSNLLLQGIIMVGNPQSTNDG